MLLREPATVRHGKGTPVWSPIGSIIQSPMAGPLFDEEVRELMMVRGQVRSGQTTIFSLPTYVIPSNTAIHATRRPWPDFVLHVPIETIACVSENETEFQYTIYSCYINLLNFI